MVYQFTQAQLDRLEACRLQFNRLTRSRWSLEQFIDWTVKQSIKDSEVAAKAVRLALPESAARSSHVH